MNEPMTRQDMFARLTRNWLFWAPLCGLEERKVSDRLSDNEIRSTSSEYSVHLREDAEWWVVDTVDDRGQLRENVAKFSSYGLAEKFLMWQWSSTARNTLHLAGLGPELHARGIDSSVAAVEVITGIYELRLGAESAVLMEPSATIFSHLMSSSVDEIEAIVKVGITES